MSRRTEPQAQTSMRVLFSVKSPTADTNPFITLLAGSVRPEVKVNYFGWLSALFGRYDVLHVHWPEDLIRSRKRAGKVLKYLLFAWLYVRLKISKKPVVWTVHNTVPHDQTTTVERICLHLFESLVTKHVFLTQAQADTFPTGGTIIPHGHYKDVYPGNFAVMENPRTNILYFGFVRKYKGLEGLLRAYEAMEESEKGAVKLTIAGKPKPATYGMELSRDFAAVEGVEWRLNFLDDVETVELFSQCALVVLPYLNMGNSGALILGLSFCRPVLAPSNPVTREIQNEVGSEWLFLYEGELTPGDIANAMRQVPMPGSQPDLSQRDWEKIGKAYHEVYLARS